MKNLIQDYSAYTEEDKKVWQTLFERQMLQLKKVASEEFLRGIQKIGFRADRIPVFEELNKRLNKLTGWSLEVVPEIVPEKEYFQMLSEKKISAISWLRNIHQLDYLEEPDMFHDVFGHAPLISNQIFCDFFYGLGKLGVKYNESKVAMELLGRIYWFTVELGLIRENNGLKIYGAGILSSLGETVYALCKKPQYLDFDIKKILSTPYQNDRIQHKYFIIDSYEQLFNSLGTIEEELLEILEYKEELLEDWTKSILGFN